MFLVAAPTEGLTQASLSKRESYGNLTVIGEPSLLIAFRLMHKHCSAEYASINSTVNAYLINVYLYLQRQQNVEFGGKSPNGKRYYFDITATLLLPRDPDRLGIKTPIWATTQCMVLAHELEEAFTYDHFKAIDQENEVRKQEKLLLRVGQGRMSHYKHTDAVISIGSHIERFHLSETDRWVTSVSYNPAR